MFEDNTFLLFADRQIQVVRFGNCYNSLSNLNLEIDKLYKIILTSLNPKDTAREYKDSDCFISVHG